MAPQESRLLFRRPYQMLWMLAFLLPLSAFAYIGHFSRYIADDYCTTAVALSQGLVGSVQQWYTTWAGQYTNWTLKGIIAYLGTGFPGVLPALILVLWLGASVWTLIQVISALGLSVNRSLCWTLGAMAVFAVFAGIPSIIQSLYWFGASIPYTLPLAGLIFYIGFFLRTVRETPPDRIPVFSMVIVLWLTLIAGGTSEVFAAFQIAVIGLISLGSQVIAPGGWKRSVNWLSGASLLGSVAALILIVAAPGTAVRQAAFSQHLTLVDIVIETVLASVSYIVLAIGVFSPIPLLISVIVSAVTIWFMIPPNAPVRLRPQKARRLLALPTAVAFMLMMACFAPSIYAVAVTPPARVYIFPQLVMVCLACSWGFIMGLSVKRRRNQPNRLIVGLAVLLLVIGPLLTAIQTLATAPQFSVFASEWDTRDQAIRAAVSNGVQQVDVNMLSVDMGAMAALEPIGTDPAGGVNQCAAQYYGAKSLTAQSLLKVGDKSS